MPMSSAAQQVLCACITPDMRSPNTCCASGYQLVGDIFYIISLSSVRRSDGFANPSGRRKLDGFSNFCIFFLEFSEKNRKFAIRYQLSQYFAMGKYINPFTSTCLFLSLTRRLKNVKVILTNGFMY